MRRRVGCQNQSEPPNPPNSSFEGHAVIANPLTTTNVPVDQHLNVLPFTPYPDTPIAALPTTPSGDASTPSVGGASAGSVTNMAGGQGVANDPAASIGNPGSDGTVLGVGGLSGDGHPNMV